MNTRITLMLMAATVAPLCAQQPATPPAHAAQPFTALAAPATAAPATPEQRAAVFGSLALLPQDISDFLVLPNIGGNLLRLAESGRIPTLPADEAPAELMAIDNLAIATTPATPGTYALLEKALSTLYFMGMGADIIGDWEASARDGLAELIHKEMEQALLRDMGVTREGGLDLGDQPTHIPASYAILTVKPGQEAMLEQWHAAILANLQGSEEEFISAVNDVNGFSGVRLDLAKLREMTQEAETEPDLNDPEQLAEEALKNELGKHTLCVLTRLQGNALILAVCEDPQELKLAATPAESLLATDKVACCDANLDKGMIGASLASPALSELYKTCSSGAMLKLAPVATAIFTKLAEADAANKPAYEQAAAAATFLGNELRNLNPAITRPTTTQVWFDGKLHIRSTADAQGASYLPGTLRLATMAEAPATALYMESTPVKLATPLPDIKVLMEAALDVAHGVSLTLHETEKTQAAGGIATVQAFMPELQSLAAASATIGSGLDGQFAFVLDSAHGPMPAFAGAEQGAQADVPRLALYAGVSDRSKLGEGWEGIITTAGQVAAKLGGDPAAVSMLPIVPSQQGAVTSYSVALPFFTPDCVPNLSLTDKGLALGSSSLLNAQLVESATGTTPFEGCAISFRFAPLGRSLRSLSTALDPKPEEAKPVAEFPDENCKDCEQSDELICEDCMKQLVEQAQAEAAAEAARTPQEKAADDLADAAEFFENAATIVEGIRATSTVEDGQHILNIEVNFK